MKNWAYKVVKKQRGMQGQWFAHPAAFTTADAQTAIDYARTFASEQTASGVLGTRIVVLSRKGGECVAEFKV